MIRVLTAATCAAFFAVSVNAQTISDVYSADTTAEAVASQAAVIEPTTANALAEINPDLGVYGPTWNGDITATASASTGNSDTTDVGIFGRAGTTRGLLTHEVNGGFAYATGDGETTKNKFYGGYQLNRSFADGAFGLDGSTYGYATVRSVFDQLGAYRHDHFVGVGLGKVIVNNDTARWTLEGGPGVRYLDGNNGGDSEINVAARLASRFNYSLNDNVGFRNDTTVLWAPEDTAIINDAFLRFGLSENLDAKLGLLIEYHTNPPAGLETTDTTTYVGIGYRF